MPIDTIPATPTFIDGQRVGAAELNGLASVANLAAEPVGFSFGRGANQTLRPEDKNIASWNATHWNTTTSAPATEVIVPIDGMWQLTFQAQFIAKTGTEAAVHLRIIRISATTGTETAIALWDGRRLPSSAWSSNHQAGTERTLNAGDKLRCEITHYDSGNLSLSSSTNGSYLRARLTGRTP